MGCEQSSCAVQVYKHHGIEAQGSPPARERSDWFNADVGLSGSPLLSAQAVPASEVHLKTPRMCLMCLHAETGMLLAQNAVY